MIEVKKALGINVRKDNSGAWVAKRAIMIRNPSRELRIGPFALHLRELPGRSRVSMAESARIPKVLKCITGLVNRLAS